MLFGKGMTRPPLGAVHTVCTGSGTGETGAQRPPARGFTVQLTVVLYVLFILFYFAVYLMDKQVLIGQYLVLLDFKDFASI